MKHLKVLTALSVGILASTSGMVQVGATTYSFFEDFSTKEVTDFTAFKQTFNEDTSNLNLEINFEFFGEYKFDSCPTAFNLDVRYFFIARANGTGSFQTIGQASLPDFTCTTIFTYYETNITSTLSSSFLDLVVNDDTDFIELAGQITFVSSVDTIGRTLSLQNYSYYFDLTYNFGTTYLFNYFLSDQRYQSRLSIGTWTFNIPQISYLNYVYTTAGNDSFYIRNTDTSTLGTNRKKYAVDSDETFFRGQSVGAGFFSDHFGVLNDEVVLGASDSILRYVFRYYYLNVANLAQAIVDAPLIDFNEESCSGGFLDINVACYVNNAIAYLVNDAPVISDAFTLLNTGIELAAQTFGIIGSFSDDNVFGYLILVGFGFIAVKWFLKNDE
jgi:hypothetical protein